MPLLTILAEQKNLDKECYRPSYHIMYLREEWRRVYGVTDWKLKRLTWAATITLKATLSLFSSGKQRVVRKVRSEGIPKQPLNSTCQLISLNKSVCNIPIWTWRRCIFGACIYICNPESNNVIQRETPFIKYSASESVKTHLIWLQLWRKANTCLYILMFCCDSVPEARICQSLGAWLTSKSSEGNTSVGKWIKGSENLSLAAFSW